MGQAPHHAFTISRRFKNSRIRGSQRAKAKIGSSFDSFLKEVGRYELTPAVAIKRVLAWQIAEAMRSVLLSKIEMAKKMHTSRSQLERLLDPENDAVSLEILARAAHAVGRKLKLELL
jgi:antitoxin HicB